MSRLYNILDKIVNRGCVGSRIETVTAGSSGFTFTPSHGGQLIIEARVTGSSGFIALRQGNNSSAPRVCISGFPNRVNIDFTSYPVNVEKGVTYYMTYGDVTILGMNIFY